MRDASVNGFLGMQVDGKLSNRYRCEIIHVVGKEAWKDGFNDTDREKGYVQMGTCQGMIVLQILLC